MFEALRRAEETRKQRMMGGPYREVPTSVAEPSAVHEAGVLSAAVPQVERPPMVDPAPELRPSDDAYREMGILRNSIDSLLENNAKRSILFTSAAPGDGTTTVANNYAALIAMKGDVRVLLVEMNARKPALARRFGLTGQGMTHYLSGRVALTNIVNRTGAGYDVVHVGDHDPGQIQLLAQKGFPPFMKEAHQRYDVVIVDAPPVFSAPETPPLTPMVDGVVVVLKCNKTKRELVQRSLAMIKQSRGNILGVVLNRKKYYIPEFIYKRL